jgi:hypothetical protein
MARKISKNGKIYYTNNGTSPRSAFDPAFEDDFVVPTLSDEEIRQKLDKRFSVLERVTHKCINGDISSLIVYGPAGVGKSYGVKHALDSAECRYTFVSGYATKIGLMKTLYSYRHKGDVVVFDDCDSVLFDETSLSILKAICDTTGERNVSYITDKPIYPEDETGVIPSTFAFEGTVIFITNTDFENVSKRIEPHTKAMMSRSVYIDLAMRTRRDYLVRIHQVIDAGMLDMLGLAVDEKADIIDYINTNYERMKELSLRVVVKLAQLRKGDAEFWKEEADVTELRRS